MSAWLGAPAGRFAFGGSETKVVHKEEEENQTLCIFQFSLDIFSG